jgi:hypothetical protein
LGSWVALQIKKIVWFRIENSIKIKRNWKYKCSSERKKIQGNSTKQIHMDQKWKAEREILLLRVSVKVKWGFSSVVLITAGAPENPRKTWKPCSREKSWAKAHKAKHHTGWKRSEKNKPNLN